MPSFKENYDEDVIQQIMRSAGGRSKEEEKELNQAKEKLSKRVFSKSEEGNEVLFAETFWKPEYIPNIPIRVYRAGEWDSQARIRIPNPNPHWVWPRKTTELMALAMYCKDTTLLWGLPGTGKSDLPQQWCAKFNIPFWRMGCHAETREVHFVGNVSVGYDEQGRMHIEQEPTILTDSLRYGGIYVEDEAFRHSAALVLQPLREKNTRTLFLPDAPGHSSEERVLQAPDNWWYIMTDNTCGLGDETGVFDAEVQDASTLDRIGTSIEVDYLDPEVEVDIIRKAHSSVPKPIAEMMVRYAGAVRADFANSKMLTTMSVRGLLTWAEKIELIGDVRTALRICWFNKLSRDDQSKAGDIYHQVFAESLGE